MNETIARLIMKVPRKIRTPMSTLRHVSAKTKSESKSNILMQFAARVQDRSQKFLHYLFRNAVEIEFRFFGNLPELIETACTRAFECKYLDQKVQNVGSFAEARP